MPPMMQARSKAGAPARTPPARLFTCAESVHRRCYCCSRWWCWHMSRSSPRNRRFPLDCESARIRQVHAEVVRIDQGAARGEFREAVGGGRSRHNIAVEMIARRPVLGVVRVVAHVVDVVLSHMSADRRVALDNLTGRVVEGQRRLLLKEVQDCRRSRGTSGSAAQQERTSRIVLAVQPDAALRTGHRCVDRLGVLRSVIAAMRNLRIFILSLTCSTSDQVLIVGFLDVARTTTLVRSQPETDNRQAEHRNGERCDSEVRVRHRRANSAVPCSEIWPSWWRPAAARSRRRRNWSRPERKCSASATRSGRRAWRRRPWRTRPRR